MFDIGFTELLVVSVVALLVVGPEKLPKLARTVGIWVGKAKRMVADVKADVDREIRNQEILDLEKARESINEVKDGLKDSTAGIGDAIEKSAGDILDDGRKIGADAREALAAADDAARRSAGRGTTARQIPSPPAPEGHLFE